MPGGDKGGNLSEVRIADGKPVKLHPMFDGLLDKSMSQSSIGEGVAEAEQAGRENSEAIDRELREHKTRGEWRREGFALAVQYAYLNGDLHPANTEQKLSDADIPTVAEEYAKNAGRMARVQVAKAGKRPAASLSDVLGARA
jgi:S1/P1 Nuclease